MRWGDSLTLLLLSVALFVVFTKSSLHVTDEFQSFEVRIEDSLALSAPLSIDSLYSVYGKTGELLVSCNGGVVRVTQANCRHRICMNQRVRQTGGTIVCAPSRVVIECKSEGEELDFIVQ